MPWRSMQVVVCIKKTILTSNPDISNFGKIRTQAYYFTDLFLEGNT